jgi:uncharacterized membrane protein YvlD (DUF360 family)
MTNVLRLVRRALVIWVIEAAALIVMVWLLPGASVTDWRTAAVAVVVIGLLNVFVRPIVLRISAALGIIPFVLVAILINAVLVAAAAWLLPTFTIDGLWTAFLLAVGLAVLNTVFSAMLSINDDDSFYRNVIRRLARRRVTVTGLDRPGTVVLQIDGLAEPILRRAIAEGRMPTLASWIASGSHRLVGWECQIPSMTTASQAGVLHGDYSDLPAFYWYEKEHRRLMASGRPSDLHDVESRLSNGQGLLAGHGWSVMALFSGDAERSIMTTTTSVDDAGKLAVEPGDFAAYMIDPYNLYRGLAGFVGEALLECWQALRQRIENVQPRTHRAGKFCLQRAASVVIARDATTWGVVLGMYQAQPVIFCNYLGYDEVGHYAGPETRDAMASLPGIDRQIRQIQHAALEAPRPYRLVVFSDHGMTTGHLFKTVYGKPLDELVRELINADSAVLLSGAKDEGLGHISGFLNELTQSQNMAGRGARRLFGEGEGDGPVDLTKYKEHAAEAQNAEVVVTSSGNLAHVYFAQVSDRLSLEQVMTTYPGLIESLVGHEGVEFVLAVSEARGPVVMTRRVVRELDAQNGLEGDDPLAQYSPHTASFLSRLARFPHSGDVMVMGKYDPSTGQVITMDELVGAHGGVGGMQTQPFVLYPSEWTDRPPTIVGADGLHNFFRQHVLGEAQSDLADSTAVVDGRSAGGELPSVSADTAAGRR